MDATAITTPIVKKLEDAWNAADGRAFGAHFAPDADFVDIRGDYHTGREPIAFGHQAILDTIYKGSVNHYVLLHARELAPGVIIAQVSASLSVPAGPLAGQNRSVFTLVLTDGASGWQIAALHNTLIPAEMDAGEREVRDRI